jgi:hypothetical protein
MLGLRKPPPPTVPDTVAEDLANLSVQLRSYTYRPGWTFTVTPNWHGDGAILTASGPAMSAYDPGVDLKQITPEPDYGPSAYLSHLQPPLADPVWRMTCNYVTVIRATDFDAHSLRMLATDPACLDDTIRDICTQVELHELAEFLRRDGIILNDPHAVRS